MISKSTLLKILVATTLAAPTFGLAQTGGVRTGGDVPATKSKEALDVTGKDFTDDSGPIVDAFAAEKGIASAEALKQLKAMRKADRVEIKLQRKFGDNFVGLEFDHAGGNLKIRVQKAGMIDADKADAKAILDSESIEYGSEVVSAPLSRSALNQMEKRIASTLRALDPKADFEFVSANASAVIYSGTTIDPSTFAFVPGGVQFKGPSQIVLTAENIIGGSAWNGNVSSTETAICTMGLKAQSPGGRIGHITAGHCNPNSPAKFDPFYYSDYSSSTGRRLSFTSGDEWIGNSLDVQLHQTVETGDASLAYYYDGTRSAPIYSTAQTYPRAGDYYCFYGRSTNKFLCGYVASGTRSSGTYGSPFYSLLSSGRGALAKTGDSGGPVVMGNEAKGIIHAYDGSTGDLIFNDVQSMRAKAGLKFYALVQ